MLLTVGISAIQTVLHCGENGLPGHNVIARPPGVQFGLRETTGNRRVHIYKFPRFFERDSFEHHYPLHKRTGSYV